MSHARRTPWRRAGSPREPGGSIPNDPAQPSEPPSERKVVHTHGGTGREYELSATVDQARSVQTCDCIDSSEMLAALAFKLRNRPRPLRIGGQQQAEDSFLCPLLVVSGHPANLILHGKVLPFLATPRAVRAAPGHFLIGFRQADRQDAIGKTYMLVSID